MKMGVRQLSKKMKLRAFEQRKIERTLNVTFEERNWNYEKLRVVIYGFMI